MAIFFRCGCGQDLRADETGAGGKTECPACGQVVAVPSLALANHQVGIKSQPLLEVPARPAPSRKADGPLERHAAQVPVSLLGLDADVGADEDQREREWEPARQLFAQARKDLEARQGSGPGWRLESGWLECLLYPFRRAWPVLLVLALAWATLAAMLMALLPEEWDWPALGPRLPLLLPVFLLLGYACAFFRCVLASATAGEAGFIRWPGADPLQVLWGGAACLICFLAGPIVPAVVAILFWLHAGDLAWVDQLILWELGLATVGLWTLALLAVDQSGRLRDANPLALVRLAGHLGWRGWLMVVLATVGVLIHFHFTLDALEELHRGPLGWLALGWWGFLGTTWVVFLLRWFGLSRFRTQQQRRREREHSLPEEQPTPATHRAAPLLISGSTGTP